MKFAETPISTQNTIYLKDQIREVLEAEPGDVLEWHITNQTVSVKKKDNEVETIGKK